MMAALLRDQRSCQQPASTSASTLTTGHTILAIIRQIRPAKNLHKGGRFLPQNSSPVGAEIQTLVALFHFTNLYYFPGSAC